MNIIQSQSNIVEKVLRDKDGKLIRARFFVYENGGRIKARLLDFVYLTEQILLNGANFLLSTVSKTKTTVTKFFGFSQYSIFFIQYSIFNLGSKPRAPTYA
ncbi:MAG: hypothetical protein CEO12_117 [Parcubacteria group bacterium Gr01-1014_46]|nr:MAG: hypothetical protein CEO12_117 [Parcubacteria group bacterium Gr01-1014_46]